MDTMPNAAGRPWRKSAVPEPRSRPTFHCALPAGLGAKGPPGMIISGTEGKSLGSNEGRAQWLSGCHVTRHSFNARAVLPTEDVLFSTAALGSTAVPFEFKRLARAASERMTAQQSRHASTHESGKEEKRRTHVSSQVPPQEPNLS